MLIERYIVKELAFSFFLTFFTLIFIFFMYSLTTFLGEAANGMLSGAEILTLTIYKTFISLGVLVPLSYFLSLNIAFGRLNLNSELTALRVSGLNSGRIFSIVIGLGLVLSTFTAGISLEGRPWAYGQLYGLKDTIASKWEFDKVREKRFYISENEKQVVYIGSTNPSSDAIADIFIRNSNPEGFEVISAPIGSIDSFITPSSHRLSLKNAKIYKSSMPNENFYARFLTLALEINAFKVVEMKHRIKKETNAIIAFSGSNTARAEWQWRIAAPLSTLLLTLTALPLIRVAPRQGRLAKIPLAIGIYAVYYISLSFFRTSMEQGVITNLLLGPVLFSTLLCCYCLTAYTWNRSK